MSSFIISKANRFFNFIVHVNRLENDFSAICFSFLHYFHMNVIEHLICSPFSIGTLWLKRSLTSLSDLFFYTVRAWAIIICSLLSSPLTDSNESNGMAFIGMIIISIFIFQSFAFCSATTVIEWIEKKKLMMKTQNNRCE